MKWSEIEKAARVATLIPFVVALSSCHLLQASNLIRKFDEIEARTQGSLGVEIVTLESLSSQANLHSDVQFPMLSFSHVVIAAMALSEAEHGRLDLREKVSVTAKDLSPAPSEIAKNWPSRAQYTWDDLLTLSITKSDNTAADMLLARVGGPQAVMNWLSAKGALELRLDRYSREIESSARGLGDFQPAWAKGDVFEQAAQSLPVDRRQAALKEYMADGRDTVTARGAANFLKKLHDGELTTPASASRLLDLMKQSDSAPNLLKAGLPAGATIAHMGGAGPVLSGVTTGENDVGIVESSSHHKTIIAEFLSGSQAPPAVQDQAFSDMSRYVVLHYHEPR